jgi:hypothetical protein
MSKDPQASPRKTKKHTTSPPQPPKKQDTEYTDDELLAVELRTLNETMTKINEVMEWISQNGILPHRPY